MGLLPELRARPFLKLNYPSINDSGAGDASFNYTLKVANVFDVIVTDNKQHILSVDTLIVTYQIHVTVATCIINAKYEQVNIHDVAFDQTHLLLD